MDSGDSGGCRGLALAAIGLSALIAVGGLLWFSVAPLGLRMFCILMGRESTCSGSEGVVIAEELARDNDAGHDVTSAAARPCSPKIGEP